VAVSVNSGTTRQPVRRRDTLVGRNGRPRLVAALAVLSAVGTTAVVLAGSGWGGSPSWFGSDTPLGVSRVAPRTSHLVSLGGLALVVAGWLGTGLLLRFGATARQVLAVATAAALPLLVGPPLFSSDALTYVAIGEVLQGGGDPYRDGWGVTGRTDYVGRIPQFWRDTPSPYSPLSLRALQLVARATGGDLDRGVLILRVLAVVAVGATAVLLARAARRAAVPRAPAMWLAVANPVVLFGGVSGAHLDVLLAPLLLGALMSLAARRPVVAGLLLGLAAQVKITALVAVAVVLAWAVLRHRRGPRAREGVAAAAVAAAVFGGLGVVCRLGWGWASTLGVPGTANDSQTPIDAVSDLAFRAGLVHHSGSVSFSGASRKVELVALVLAALGCLAVVLVRQLPRTEAAGWALVVVSLLSGAFWFWYVLPALALVAASPPRRGEVWRRVGLALVGLAGLVGLRPGGAPARSLQGVMGDVTFLAAFAVAVAVVVVGFVRGRREDRAAA